MKIICISDTHNKLDQVSIPDGDILVHAGDATMMGKPDEIIKFNRDLGRFPHKHKIIIAGNHDWGFQIQNEKSRSYITNAIYLQDEMVEIEGIKIYGSPWQPFFFNWAFNLQRGEQIKQKWDLIPDDIDVLLTHGPPYGILDVVGPDSHNLIRQNVGCEELRKKVDNMKNLKLHVFGHIHKQHGSLQIDGKTFINASTLNDRYEVAHNPIVYNI